MTQNGDAILTVDPTNTIDWGVLNWGAWISQISVLDAAPVLTMTTPANKEVDPNTLKSITVTSEKHCGLTMSMEPRLLRRKPSRPH